MSTQLVQSVMTKEEVGLVLGHRQAGTSTTAFQAIQEARLRGLAADYVSLEELTVTAEKTCLPELHVLLLPCYEGTDLGVRQMHVF